MTTTTMMSNTELAVKIEQVLKSSDLKKTTNNILKKTLENDMGVDLSDKMSFLREQVDKFLQTQYEDDDVVDDEEEEVTTAVDIPADPNDDVSGPGDQGDDNGGGSNEANEGGPEVGPEAPVNNEMENNANNGKEDNGNGNIKNSENNNNNNGSCSLKGISKIKFVRSVKQNKEKIKRVNESGKFCTLSPELQNFLGVPHMTRTAVIKHIWNYAKEKNLKDPSDGKSILCDEALRDLLGVESITVLQINKALTKHIWPPAAGKSTRKERPKKRARDVEDTSVTENGEKSQRRVLSGFLAPLPMSDTLIKFLGTEETALTRADVIKKLWEYIKDKNLQDPSDKKTVLCDEKLKGLFQVDSFNGFLVTKLLTAHFVKNENLAA